MRFLLLLLITLCQWAPTPVAAGAWLREKGSTFTSTSFSATYFRDIASSTYLEYGFSDKMTVGLDVGYFTSRFGLKSGFGTVFLRRSIGKNEGPNKWAYEVGVGAAWAGELVIPHIKTGLSWGRGIKVKDKSGWATVDASVKWDVSQGLHVTKLDGTVGLNFTDTTAGMFQIFVTNLDGATYGTLAPSVIYTPRKGKFKIQFGAESPVDDFINTSLKIGIWREF